jgi:site-specific DNA recombinase
LKLLKAAANGFTVAQEYVDVETAKQTGRAAFSEMVAYLKEHSSVPRDAGRETGSIATSRIG